VYSVAAADGKMAENHTLDEFFGNSGGGAPVPTLA